jgi:hypothetical protein
MISLLLAGCGARFVEPHAPELFRTRGEHRIPSRKEPVTFGLVFDLYAAEGCEALHTRFRQGARDAMAKRGPTVELPEQHLSSQCQQSSSRRLNLDGLYAAWEAAANARPGFELRPIFIYLNNIDLALPAALANDFYALRTRALEQGRPPPELWAFAASSVLASVAPNQAMPWTYSEDPGLLTQLGAWAESTLPFVSTLPERPAIPLFKSDELARAQWFKVCQLDPRLKVGFAADGTPVAVAADNPPMFSPQYPPLRAATPDQLPEQGLLFELEVCSENCDRNLDLDLAPRGSRWKDFVGCVLPQEGVP